MEVTMMRLQEDDSEMRPINYQQHVERFRWAVSEFASGGYHLHLYDLPGTPCPCNKRKTINLAFLENSHRGERESFGSVARGKPNVPVYMWDIYRNGMGGRGNSNGVDVVKGVAPAFLGRFIVSHTYPNHGNQEVEFEIPKATNGDTLIDAEVRLVTNEIRSLSVGFQIFRKDANRQVFLDAKSVPPEGGDWVSLKVTPGVTETGRISFLIFSEFNRSEGSKLSKFMKYLQPLLLLSYVSDAHHSAQPKTSLNYSSSSSYVRETRSAANNIRRKRTLYEEYEEETNRIWEGEATPGKRLKVRSTCRRKPLYVDFSEIDYDTWIVAPTGYEAFQCVGRCTFPVSEHLSPTKHAIVQTLMHHVSPTKAGRACCVPTRLDPISILYVDSNGILTYRFRYQDMVVAECGCR